MENKKPKGELAIQVLAMPKDTNPSGDIFGGWLISQMDIAGAVISNKIAKGRVVTIAMDAIVLKSPVFVGDTVSCHVSCTSVGKTSIRVHIEAWANRGFDEKESIMVTSGDFTYVKVDENRKPVTI